MKKIPRQNFPDTLIVMIALLIGMNSHAQNLNTDLALTVTAPQFESGVLPGETGTLTVQVTNLGPQALDLTADGLYIFPGENVNQNVSLYFEFIRNQRSEDGCELVLSEGSPLPPLNGVYYLHHYLARIQLPVGATFDCEIQVAFEHLSVWQTTWRLGGPGFNDLNPNNDTFPLTFRGIATPVPLLHSWFLVLILMSVTGFYLNRTDRE